MRLWHPNFQNKNKNLIRSSHQTVEITKNKSSNFEIKCQKFGFLIFFKYNILFQ